MNDFGEAIPGVYVVRAEFGRYARAFVQGGYVAIGWFEDTELTERYHDREVLRALYKQYEPEASPMRIAQNVGQVMRFLTELTPETFVITPTEDNSRLRVGRITGDYYFQSATDSPYPHRKPVSWYDEPLVRSALSIPLQTILRASLTIFQVAEYEEIFERYSVPLPNQSKKIAMTETEIARLVLDRILELSPDEFEILITELLAGIGLTNAEHTGKSGDDGVDVQGTLEVYSFMSVDLKVQVKRYAHDKISHQTIQQFRSRVPERSQAAFVTTSDFTSKAREEAEREGFKKVGLINGIQLVGILVENYDHLSEEVKTKLGLRKTLIPGLKS